MVKEKLLKKVLQQIFYCLQWQLFLYFHLISKFTYNNCFQQNVLKLTKYDIPYLIDSLIDRFKFMERNWVTLNIIL